MARIIVMITALALGGCAVTAMTPEKWAAVPDDRICVGVSYARAGYKPQADGINELRRRDMVRNQYMETIQAKKIALGMNTCELVASWGPPTDTNRSVHQWGTDTQWVYGTFTRSGGPKYVYTENQVVTSWQE